MRYRFKKVQEHNNNNNKNPFALHTQRPEKRSEFWRENLSTAGVYTVALEFQCEIRVEASHKCPHLKKIK